MELSGYSAEILGGRHFAKPTIRPVFESLTRFPWSPFGSTPTLSGSERSYVELDDGQHYQLRLSNDHPTRCNARVEIDGKLVGVWRLNPYQSIEIERPVKVDKKFTFYRVRDSNGFREETGIRRGDPKNGLIQVKFTPERHPTRWPSYLHEDDWLDDRFSYNQITPLSRSSLASAARRGSYLKGRQPQSCFSSNKSTVGLQCMEASVDSPTMSNYIHCQGATALKGHSDQYFNQACSIDLDPSRSVTINLRLVARRRERDRSYYDRVTPLGCDAPVSNPIPPPVTWRI